MRVFKSRVMQRYSLFSRVPPARHRLSKALMKSCIKRSPKHGQAHSSVFSHCYCHPAMAVETLVRCSAAFEDQQINFTPLFVINSQGDSEQTQHSSLCKTFQQRSDAREAFVSNSQEFAHKIPREKKKKKQENHSHHSKRWK